MEYFIKKFVTLIITLLIVSILAFLAFQVISDPASSILGTQATPEKLAELRHELGLDRSLSVQYFSWLKGFVTGDWGTSYSYSLPVRTLIAEKLPVTFGITIISFILMLIMAFPIAIFTSWHAYSRIDKTITVINQVAMSVPAFLLGVGITYLFGIVLRVFTPGEIVSFSEKPGKWLFTLLFPALAIAVPRTAMTVKMLRASIIGQIDKDYVRTSYSHGADNKYVLKTHILRNAVIPVISFIASCMAEIVANCILVEQVFALPGIGVLLLNGIGNRDVPVVQALVMLLAVWVIVVIFIADLLYQLVDPRIRLS